MYMENRFEQISTVTKNLDVIEIRYYDKVARREISKDEYDRLWEEILTRRMAEAMQRPIGLSV